MNTSNKLLIAMIICLFVIFFGIGHGGFSLGLAGIVFPFFPQLLDDYLMAFMVIKSLAATLFLTTAIFVKNMELRKIFTALGVLSCWVSSALMIYIAEFNRQLVVSYVSILPLLICTIAILFYKPIRQLIQKEQEPGSI